MQQPTKPGNYKLLSGRQPSPSSSLFNNRNNTKEKKKQKQKRRIDYGVDYSTYTSVLARDFNGLPNPWTLFRRHDLKTATSYVLGASFVPYYRLTGPFFDASARETCTTELWETVTRRGVGGNFFFGLLPMLFYGWINFTAWLLEMLYVLPVEEDRDEVDAYHDTLLHYDDADDVDDIVEGGRDGKDGETVVVTTALDFSSSSSSSSISNKNAAATTTNTIASMV